MGEGVAPLPNVLTPNGLIVAPPCTRVGDSVTVDASGYNLCLCVLDAVVAPQLAPLVLVPTPGSAGGDMLVPDRLLWQVCHFLTGSKLNL